MWVKLIFLCQGKIYTDFCSGETHMNVSSHPNYEKL